MFCEDGWIDNMVTIRQTFLVFYKPGDTGLPAISQQTRDSDPVPQGCHEIPCRNGTAQMHSQKRHKGSPWICIEFSPTLSHFCTISQFYINTRCLH